MAYNFYVENDDLVIEGIEEFDLKQIFDCGQAFRWDVDDFGYTGIVEDNVVTVKRRGFDVLITNTDSNKYKELWHSYFDLKRDYNKLKLQLKEDSVLELALDYGSGMRILKQNPWEILISFIISANNGIKRIKGIIKKISEKHGSELVYKNRKYYTFPNPELLASSSVEELKECGAGYRAPYILSTARNVCEGKIDLDCIYGCSYEEAFEMIQQCMGVGPKVADCILLYGYGKSEAFPVDVWVKRIVETLYFSGQRKSLKYIKSFAKDRFGNLAGFAQQYLFFYGRELKIGKS